MEGNEAIRMEPLEIGTTCIWEVCALVTVFSIQSSDCYCSESKPVSGLMQEGGGVRDYRAPEPLQVQVLDLDLHIFLGWPGVTIGVGLAARNNKRKEVGRSNKLVGKAGTLPERSPLSK